MIEALSGKSSLVKMTWNIKCLAVLARQESGTEGYC